MIAADPFPFPLVHAEGLVQVSEHVHVIGDRSVPKVPNVGIVVGDRATLVIDPGMGLRNGEIVLAATRAVSGDTPLRLMTTHIHPEHDLGAGAFPADAVMIRARSQVREIDEVGLEVARDFARQSPGYAELLQGAEFRRADVVFERTLTVDLGGVRVRLVAMGANHTPGDTVALVEQDGVLFAGDIAMTFQPAFASPRSSVNTWFASLNALQAMEFRLIVPSHGPMGDDALIEGYRSYLRGIRRRTTELRRSGHSVEEVVGTVVAEMARYPDPGRTAGAVRVAYAEAAASPTHPPYEEDA